ncbi:hypothetical protein MNBD_BACTEROID07-1960 [hydrothermal vent metagenome]|uniref:N-acetyltransferase domain-containing protein n=1 Tax=hydrothermal vent metagenome TaxID=652676 RepID=A0A3B0UQ06_9ZZZZ
MKPEKFHTVVVDGGERIRDFLDFPATLYKSDKNWIRPLDEEIEKVFNPETNKLFRHGKAVRWVLLNEKQKPVGRLAAFYDRKSALKNKQPTGGIGFFDCIDNQNAANILFDTGKTWLQNRGMEAMDGPVNFGDRDNFWGCLAEGFQYEPVFNMPYNYPYYNNLFENYGFKNYFNQYTYHIDVQGGSHSPVIGEKAVRLHRDPAYHFEILSKKNASRIANDFMVIFNKAWARFPGVSRIRKEQARALFKTLKPIMDRRAVIFGYYHDDPVAFYVMVPDLNQIIRKFNGKMNLLNKLQLMADLKIFKKCNRLIGLIFGVVPEHQGKGVESAIVARFEEEIFSGRVKYTDLEMNWIGDFNPGMIKFVGQIGGEVRKIHITYRYLFDRNRKFERAKKTS